MGALKQLIDLIRDISNEVEMCGYTNLTVVKPTIYIRTSTKEEADIDANRILNQIKTRLKEL